MRKPLDLPYPFRATLCFDSTATYTDMRGRAMKPWLAGKHQRLGEFIIRACPIVRACKIAKLDSASALN